jgi:predicted Rossmann fold nucleotide-binding protein DprA/Smf involved in DNA uptake
LSVWWKGPKDLHGMKMFQFQQRLKHVRWCIRKWNKEVFGNIFEEKRKLEQEMEEIQQKGIQGIYSSDLSFSGRLKLEKIW